MRYASVVLTLLLGVALAACHDSTGPTTDLMQTRIRWAQHGPEAYQLAVSNTCFCPWETMGPVNVTVVNGVAQSRVYVQTGETVPEAYAQFFPSVDGLFAYIDHALQHGPPVDARFDPTLGYPVHITAGDHPEVDGQTTTDVTLSALPQMSVR